MTESQYALDTVEQIYMSFGDNQTDEAMQVLNKYSESYHQKQCEKCTNVKRQSTTNSEMENY